MSTFYPLRKKVLYFLLLLAMVAFNNDLKASNDVNQDALDVAVKLTKTHLKLGELFTILEKQTHFRFAYDASEINLEKEVEISQKIVILKQLLTEVSKESGASFQLSKNVVTVIPPQKEKEVTAEPKSSAATDVSGKVVNKNGEPVSGAAVVVKGTNKGTTTDANGNFKIDAVEGNVLEITFVGYETMEVTVSKTSGISVVLNESKKILNDVVVIGYGTQRQRNISGSVSTISTKQIASNPAPNLSNSLMGRTPGIIATQRSGEPGNDASDIYIRGIGTMGDASPVYVIDGIVRSSTDFSQLNPGEIENFSVLKDAASAAVFGVRGGNGVILVTTKRGSSGKMQITYNANYGVQQRTRVVEMLNSYEYATLYNEALANDGKPPLYSQDILNKYKNHTDPDAFPDADWSSILKKNAMITQHDLSATGGSEKLRYATSLSYLNQDGIVPSNNFKRYNFRSNIDADVTKTTTLSFDLSGRSEATNNIYEDGLFRWIQGTTPTKFPIRFSNGYYAGGPSYNALPDNGYRKRNTSAFRGRLQLLQKLPFVEGLSVKFIGSYDKTFSDFKNWFYPVIPFYTRLPDGTYRKETSKSSLSQNHYDNQAITLETHLNYERQFGKSKVTGLLLYTQTKEVWSALSAYREQYSLNIDEMNFGPSVNRNNGGYSGSSGRQGVVGRTNLTYDDKYILEASFRSDGSEQFAKDKRWGFFPSVSGAYVISKEKFMEKVKAINFLKLRASYGVLGNDRIGGSRFLYLQSYYQSGYAVFGNADVQQAILEGTLSNPNVTWETVKKLDIGFDASFLNGKLTTTFDYFYDKRSDILGRRNASVPALLGIGLPVENYAKVDNQGIELSIGHQNNITKDLRYSINGNITYARNKIVYIDEPASTNPNIKLTGRPIGTEFGFRALGIFQSQDEVDKAPKQIGPTGPGDIRYDDVMKKGKIDDDARVPIGTANTPEIVYGFNGAINFKSLELSFLLQGATHVNQWYRGEGAWPFFVGAGAMKTNLDRWTPDNRNASEPRVLISSNNMNHANSTFWLKDASYLRLRNVEIAYNIPKSLLARTRAIQGLRIYVNCNNVFTWSKIKNFDPENGSDRGWSYPQLRIINAGVNVQF